MIVYTLETKVERQVCLDGVLHCPNPMCRASMRWRAWGSGFSMETLRGHSRSEMTITGKVRLKLKQQAELKAWQQAQQRAAKMGCPRCTRATNEGIQFAAM